MASNRPASSSPSDDKLHIAEALAEAGVGRIEAGLPAVSPSDAEAVKQIAAMGLPANIYAFARCMVSDVEMALEAGVENRDGDSLEPPHHRARLQLAYERAIAATIEATSFAHDHGLEVIFFPIDSTRANITEFLDLIETIERDGHMDGLVLVDTFGVLNPQAASFMTRKVKERINKPLETHFHMDFGLGVANTRDGGFSGGGDIQVSVSGVGERSGNVPLEDATLALKTLYGIDSGIDFSKLYGLSKLVQERAGVSVPPNRGIVGERLFHVESGSSQVGQDPRHGQPPRGLPLPSRVRGPDGSPSSSARAAA